MFCLSCGLCHFLLIISSFSPISLSISRFLNSCILSHSYILSFAYILSHSYFFLFTFSRILLHSLPFNRILLFYIILSYSYILSHSLTFYLIFAHFLMLLNILSFALILSFLLILSHSLYFPLLTIASFLSFFHPSPHTISSSVWPRKKKSIKRTAPCL